MAGRGTDIVLGGSLDAELADREAEDGERVDDATRARLKAEWQKRHDAAEEPGGRNIGRYERTQSSRMENQVCGHSDSHGENGSDRFALSPERNLVALITTAPVTRAQL